MNKLILFIALAAISISNAYAEDAKRQSVEELLILTNSNQVIDTMHSRMIAMAKGMGEKLGVKESEREIFDDYMTETFNIMKEEMSWEKLKEPMIEVYLKHYTEQEIQGMLAFFRSDAGKAMINKMPAVMNDSMSISQQMVEASLPRIKALSQSFAKKIAQSRKEHGKSTAN